MTPKQALGLLHRLATAYMDVVPYEQYVTPENAAFRSQVYDTFLILAPLVLGEPAFSFQLVLCDYCHEAYGVHYIIIPNPYGYDFEFHRHCCSSCLSSLLAQNAVLAIDGRPVSLQSQVAQ